MDNDPKSYRVPILRLKDVLGDSEQEEKDVSSTNSPATQTSPTGAPPTKAQNQVSEEDILAAVIIPKGQQPMVLEASEKNDTVPAQNPKEAQQNTTPLTPPQEIVLSTKAPSSPKTFDSVQKKIVVPPKTLKPNIKKIIISEESKVQEKKSTIEIKAPTLQPQKQEFDANPTDKDILGKELLQPVENSIPVKTPPVDLKESVQIEEVDDLANLYSLVEKKLASETKIEQQENVQPAEVYKQPEIEEETPVAQEILPRIPVPEPLDIWEQDAAKPRVPYKPKPITPKPSGVEKTNEGTKDFVEQKILTQPLNSDVEIKNNEIKDSTLQTASSEKTNTEIEHESVGHHLKVEKSETDLQFKQLNNPLEKPKKATGLSNLSALRERAHKDSQTNEPHPQQTNNKNAAISSEELVHPQASLQERPRPASKHAQALADVAERLHDIGNPKTDVPVMEEIKKVTTDEHSTPEATQKVIPGALKIDVPKPSFKPIESSIPMIRTFRQDVEQAVTRNRTSVVDMISAEEKRRSGGETIRKAPREAESSWSYVFIGASMILVIAAIAIGAFLFFRLMINKDADTEFEQIAINETISYDLTSQSRDQILTGLVKLRDSLHTSLGSITEIQLTERKNVDDSTEKKSFVSTSLFLLKIESHAPGSLVRDLSDTMMFGVHELTKNEPFFIFTASHYDITFKSMFEWESTIQDDLSPLFGTPVKTRPSTSFSTTTNATGTTPAVVTSPPPELFEDIIIANTQTRGIRNATGDAVLIWAIPDEKTLIITNNETTMRTLLERMDARPF